VRALFFKGMAQTFISAYFYFPEGARAFDVVVASGQNRF
jgi:hypothetical protein